jgi:hypothetical protein
LKYFDENDYLFFRLLEMPSNPVKMGLMLANDALLSSKYSEYNASDIAVVCLYLGCQLSHFQELQQPDEKTGRRYYYQLQKETIQWWMSSFNISERTFAELITWLIDIQM